MKVAIRRFIDKLGKATSGKSGKVNSRRDHQWGIYSKCVCKEIYHQTAENTQLPKQERMNNQCKGTMVKQANTKLKNT